EGNVDSQKIAQVLDTTVDAYVSVVQAKTQSSPSWPSSRDPGVWAVAAALQLAVAKKEIAAARASGAIPFTALRQLNRVTGWTRGEEDASSDPLSAYDDMVTRGVAALSNAPLPPQ